MRHLIGEKLSKSTAFQNQQQKQTVLKIAIFHGLFYTYKIGMEIFIINIISTHEYYAHHQ